MIDCQDTLSVRHQCRLLADRASIVAFSCYAFRVITLGEVSSCPLMSSWRVIGDYAELWRSRRFSHSFSHTLGVLRLLEGASR
jgi:hypothetical protein